MEPIFDLSLVLLRMTYAFEPIICSIPVTSQHCRIYDILSLTHLSVLTAVVDLLCTKKSCP